MHSEFLEKWQGKYPCVTLIREYIPLAEGLLYGEEEVVIRIIQMLRDNMEAWARAYSPVYRHHVGPITQKELEDKGRWYVRKAARYSEPMSDGDFQYLCWRPAKEIITKECAFVCDHGTLHQADNYSYAFCEDGKLLRTDYFNVVSPFVNYWNGDVCENRTNGYRRCGCGQLYRPL